MLPCFFMLHGAHSHRSADHILRNWLTYFLLFVILYLKNLQLGQGVSFSQMKLNSAI